MLALSLRAQQPVKIHSHNDYDQAEPFSNAWRNKAYTIEADVYPGDSLYVSHKKEDIKPGRTLVHMYLQPIAALFAKYHGYISGDTTYAPVLMIDIKENSAVVIPALVKLLEPLREAFDRSVNPHSVQVVLSGERGAPAQWNQWPSYILFDGRPYETYDSATLRRVAFISDTYSSYASSKGVAATAKRLKALAEQVHASGKLLRLWATPDNPEWWAKLRALGVDIINTDQVTRCAAFFRDNQAGSPDAQHGLK